MKLMRKIKIVISDAKIRNRLLFVLGMLILFRMLSAIPVPGVDRLALDQFLNQNQFLGLLSLFSGGGLSQLSLLMLGVGVYITASIIMQLLTILSPKLKSMYHEEGEAGRRRFIQISRILSIPIGFIQGFGLIFLLIRQGIIAPMGPLDLVINLVTVVAGAILVMWMGELMTEYGIGNGISVLIFAGIVAQLPATVAQLIYTFDQSQLPVFISLGVAIVLIIAGVIVVTEAERSVPIAYARQSREGQVFSRPTTYLPLRLNQAGVMPIIFALSILLFPQMLANFFINSTNPILQSIASSTLQFLNMSWLYALVYFFLVFGFTYFYTAITFDTEAVATNLQKNGAFIPGIRPGKSTEDYLNKIVNRITFIGAIFLGLIAVLPIVIQALTNLQALAIGGTAVLIVVSVIIDINKKLEAQLSMREY